MKDDAGIWKGKNIVECHFDDKGKVACTFGDPMSEASYMTGVYCETSKKTIVALVLFALSVSFIPSIFTGRPEMLYFCTIAVIISAVTIFYDNVVLNSLVMAYAPIYVYVIILTIIYPSTWAWIIHGANVILSVGLTIIRWRKTSPTIVIPAAFCYAAYNFTFKTYVLPWGADAFFNALTIMSVTITIAITVAVSTASWFLSRYLTRREVNYPRL